MNESERPSVEGLMKLVFAFGKSEAAGGGRGDDASAEAYKTVWQYAQCLCAVSAQPVATIPAAWLCEFVREDGSTDTEVVLDDPECTRWADSPDGDGVSPYRVTPLFARLDGANAGEKP